MDLFVHFAKKHGLPVLALVIASCVYFYPQLGGKSITQPDTDHSYRGTKESWDYYAKMGERNLWTNSQFGGMPTIQSGGLENKNIFQYLDKLGKLFIKRPIGTFVFGSIAMYILMITLGVGPWLSTIGALTFVFTTQYVILYSVGHNSKLDVLMTLPLILAGAYSLFRKNYWVGATLLTIGVGLNIYENHYQMTWYIVLFMAFYYALEAYKVIKEKDTQHLMKVGLFSLVAIILAVGPSTTRILTTLDYTPESIRGKTIVEYEGGAAAGQGESGLDWEFATRFSYNFTDLAGMIVPRFAGGSGKELIDNNSGLARSIYNSNYPRKSRKVPLYYGNQPFTEGPSYIGIVVFFLFVMGMVMMRSHWRWWALGCVGFGVIYSLGSTLGGFHKFLYQTIPLFERFRAPSSFLSVIAMFFPLIGVMAIHNLTKAKNKEAWLKPLYIVGGTLLAFCAIFWAVGPSMLDMTHAADQKMISQGVSAEALQTQRVDYFRSDLLRGLLLVLVSAGAIFAFLKDKINTSVLVGVLGLLSIYDLASVNYRYVYPDRFSENKTDVGKFDPKPHDLQILQDKDPHFRVMDLTQDPFRSSDVSYFHKSLGGYHAAKLRRYQDVIDFYLKKGSGRLIAMLNGKYLLRKNENGETYVEPNASALGNAWFVDQLKFVNSNKAELTEIGNVEPARVAVIHNEFSNYLSGLSPQKNGNIKLTSYSPDELVYQYTSPTENLAVFSEVYYGPKKGWQAYIDGNPVDHIRVGYILRGLRVPPGTHSIKFVFDPASYRNGEMISMIFSIICALGLGFLIYKLVTNAPKIAPSAAPKKVIKKKVIWKKKKK